MERSARDVDEAVGNAAAESSSHGRPRRKAVLWPCEKSRSGSSNSDSYEQIERPGISMATSVGERRERYRGRTPADNRRLR